MKIISASAINFGSYAELNFDFRNQGLTLIAGPTGSGKSTLCDLSAWTLFGRSSKGGSVDEVRNWNAIEPTKCSIEIENDSGYPKTTTVITRIRGSKAKDNDLYYSITGFGGEKVRGRDLIDTQKLINSMLDMDYDLYVSGAHYHEFSQTAQFFTTTAKNRRLICEQLVDLSLAIKLKDKLTEKCKLAKINLDAVLQSSRDDSFRLQEKKKAETIEVERAQKWQNSHESTITYTIKNYDRFESNRKRIISNQCAECGTQLACPKEVVDTSENPYIEALAKLEAETNPFKAEIKDFSKDIKEIEARLLRQDAEQSQWKQEISDLDQLQEVIQDYRSVSIKNTINYIETQTNQMLTDYFDSEFRVGFTAEHVDKLEVSILKDGNQASFTQLSKGQRCLLKLCFGVSVMQAVQNHHGETFGEVFLDESLDGLDEVMKAKAFKMLESVSMNYGSVFVVEHSEGLKSLFSNAFSVRLVNGESQIEQT